jgi:hypothetical protein
MLKKILGTSFNTFVVLILTTFISSKLFSQENAQTKMGRDEIEIPMPKLFGKRNNFNAFSLSYRHHLTSKISLQGTYTYNWKGGNVRNEILSYSSAGAYVNFFFKDNVMGFYCTAGVEFNDIFPSGSIRYGPKRLFTFGPAYRSKINDNFFISTETLFLYFDKNFAFEPRIGVGYRF